MLASKQDEWQVREARALVSQQAEAISESETTQPIIVTKRLSPDDDSLLNDNESDTTTGGIAGSHQHSPLEVSFSDFSGSDSDSGVELLGRNKLFRHPLRPAANKQRAVVHSADHS